MAESQTQDTGTTGGAYEGAGAGSTSGRGTGFFTHRVWLWILLMLLVVVLFTYDHVAFKDFRENAYSRTEPLVAEWTQKAKRLYECGIPGCKSAKLPVTGANTATAKPGEVATVNPTGTNAPGNPAPAIPSSAQPVAPATTPATEGQAPGGQAPAGAVNYPAYPEYPPYPSYPPFYGSGNGSSADMTSATAGNSPAQVTPQEMASAKPHQAPVAPTPPKPEASPGKPAYPNYPAYPSYPSGGGSASPSPADGQAAYPSSPSVQAYQPPVAMKQAQPAPLPPKLVPVTPPVRPNQKAASANARPSSNADRQVDPVATDSLFLARQAAAAGRFQESVHEYLQYLTKHPEDGNAYGELGNVYLTVGRFQEAAQNYYEVATRLVDHGQLAALPRLMPIIERYEPRLAVLVYQKIANRSRGQPQ
jgi:hypothetical protein